MKKRFLLVSMLCLSLQLGWAQTSYETALTTVVGSNTGKIAEADTVYWKYTATEDCMFAMCSKTYFSPKIELAEGDGKYTTMSFASFYPSDNTNNVKVPVKKGETIYVKVKCKADVAFDFTASVTPANDIDKGKTENDAVTLVPGNDILIGGRLESDPYDATYATYTAAEDGLLKLTCSYRGGGCTVKEGSNTKTLSFDYNNGFYTSGFPVEAGKTYQLALTKGMYNIVLSTELTHPTEGSLDMPFALADGENVVPKAAGKYYYTYLPENPGVFTVTSDETFSGSVKLYTDKSSLSYSPAAQADAGSYNLSYKADYIYGDLYLVVERTEDGAADGHFTMNYTEYKKGETENNPIVISELPGSATLESAKGTVYYAVDIPGGSYDKILVVKAKNAVKSSSLTVYPQGNTYYAQTSENGSVAYDLANNSRGGRFIIKWTADEAEPIEFSVSLSPIQAGDQINNPLVPVLGQNKISGESTTKYYIYKPTKPCKLSITADASVTVSFPRGTSSYSGEWDKKQNGNMTYVVTQEGVTYYIKLDNVKDGQTFTLEERGFDPGETRDTPLTVVDGLLNFGNHDTSDLWIEYTATKNGVLEVECDADFSYSQQIEFGKSTDATLTSMTYSEVVDGNYITKYKGQLVLTPGEKALFHVFTWQADWSKNNMTFNLREFADGEVATKPIELKRNEEVTIPHADQSVKKWIMFHVGRGQNRIVFDGEVVGDLYKTLEDAKAGRGAIEFRPVLDSEDDTYGENTYAYEFYASTDDIGDYYVELRKTVGNAKAKFIDESADGISSINAGGAALSVVSGGLSVAADANVSVYSLDGSLVKSGRMNAGSVVSLKKGAYIVSVNGKTAKVLVK